MINCTLKYALMESTEKLNLRKLSSSRRVRQVVDGMETKMKGSEWERSGSGRGIERGSGGNWKWRNVWGIYFKWPVRSTNFTLLISQFDMSCAQAHWVGSKPIRRVMQLHVKLHKSTMAIGYILLMCARHVDSTNPGRSNLVFRSNPIPEAEMSNRLIKTADRPTSSTCRPTLNLYHTLMIWDIIQASEVNDHTILQTRINYLGPNNQYWHIRQCALKSMQKLLG